MLSKQVKVLWAKKNNGQWLPLVIHLQDTALIGQLLYKCFLNDAQKRLIKGKFTNQQTLNLVYLVCFLHDFGKATPNFQAKRSYDHNDDFDNQLGKKRVAAGLPSLLHSQFSGNFYHAAAGECLLTKFGLNSSVSTIIGGHHGLPVSRYFDIDEFFDDHYEDFYQVSPFDKQQHIKDCWQGVYQNLFKFGLHNSGFKSLNQISKLNEQQQIILSGLVIMSDWLASTTEINGKLLFPLINLNENVDDIDEQQRVVNGWDAWQKVSPKFQKLQPFDFKSTFGFEPSKLQRQIIDGLSGKLLDFVIIEAGCGTGKTEIALSLAYQMMKNRQQLIFGLPTQATTNTMYDRVKDYLKTIDPKSSLNLMHGKARLNKHFSQKDEWFTGKKSILEPFTVATIDHIISLDLKQRHLVLQHLSLSGKVVVLDEVHGFDDYTSSYLKETLRWLGFYHVPVIALSATLPTSKRNLFLKAYYQGRYGKQLYVAKQQNYYPLVSYIFAGQLNYLTNLDAGKSMIVNINHINDEQIISILRDKLNGGGVAGIIVNTVDRSQQLFKKLNDAGFSCLLLHSRFLSIDRQKNEQKLMSLIGKHGHRPKKLVVIGTQVLSESLDIDFDILFCDIAPIDLLIQRLGRLHRHDIKRPAKLVDSRLFLLGAQNINDYGEANEAIYSKYLLMRTNYLLKDKLLLPKEGARLVQKVYDFDFQIDLPNLAAEMLKFKQKQHQEQYQAKAFQLDQPDNNAVNLHGWLDNSQLNIISDNSLSQSVRQIKPTFNAVLINMDQIGNYFIGKHQIVDSMKIEAWVENYTLKLPTYLVSDAQYKHCIQKVNKICANWNKSGWTKNLLPLFVNDNNFIQLGNYVLNYSNQMGLIIKHLNN